MSDMTLIESIERFTIGLKKASSCARRLAVAQQNKDWLMIADNLDGIRYKGSKLCEGRSLTRQQTLAYADQVEKTIKVH